MTEAVQGEVDTRVWIGQVDPAHLEDHEGHIAWLRSAEGAEVFRRRRLIEYLLYQDGQNLGVVFRATRTGDPRVMIDFLRYPGVWPDYWQFERAAASFEPSSTFELRVHWQAAAKEA